MTLNLGVRYELNLPWVDTSNRLANFDIDTDPAHPTFVLAHDGSRADRATMAADTDNVPPRLGVVYQLGPDTVVRSGYGVFISNYEGTGGAQFLSTNPPFQIRT